MTISYQGKWGLITGASSGIGKAFAYELARRGYNLILVARRQQILETIAKDLQQKNNIKTKIIVKDLTQLSAAGEIFNAIEEAAIKVDLLINNAGVWIVGKLHNTSLRESQEQLMLNIVALSSLTQLFLPHMLARKAGAIINIASTAAFQPMPYMSNYGASKAFVLSLTEALWAEYTKHGIQFLTVCPGATEVNTTGVYTRNKKPLLFRIDRPENVALKSLEALEKNKLCIITGPIINRIFANLNRFLPRKITAYLAEKIMKTSLI